MNFQKIIKIFSRRFNLTFLINYLLHYRFDYSPSFRHHYHFLTNNYHFRFYLVIAIEAYVKFLMNVQKVELQTSSSFVEILYESFFSTYQYSFLFLRILQKRLISLFLQNNLLHWFEPLFLLQGPFCSRSKMQIRNSVKSKNQTYHKIHFGLFQSLICQLCRR